MELSKGNLQLIPEADRRAVDPPIEVEAATWSASGQLDWWVKERQQRLGRVHGPDGRQRWIKAVDLVRPRNIRPEPHNTFAARITNRLLIGIGERISIGAFLLWVVVLAVALWAHANGRNRTASLMPRARDFLARFRPVGTTGAAATAGVS